MACDKEIWHSNTFAELWVRGCDSLTISDYSSKQNNGKKSRLSLSPTLSIITRWYECGRASFSISHVCVSGEANLWPWLVLRKSPPKKINTWIFKLRKISEFPFIHHRVKTHNKLPCNRQRMKTYKELPFVCWKTKNIIWDMKETQIPK